MTALSRHPLSDHWSAWLALTAAGVVGACTVGSRQPRTEPPPVAVHAVHGARLRVVMDELQRDWMTLWPQEIDDRYPSADSPRRRAAFGRASELAERLGGTIERIPDAITETSLPEADRRSFLLLVRTLTDQIARFRSAADMRDFEALRKSFRSIDATCHSCHQRFRDVAGPL